MAEERDIDLVLITGAGASTKFGPGPQRRMDRPDLPMMAEWCSQLVQKVGRSAGQSLELTGLSPDMGGEQFERTLGDFLRRVDAFKQTGPLVEPSANLSSVPAEVKLVGVLANWHSVTLGALAEITQKIHESLFEEFSSEQVNSDASTRAYGQLLSALGVDQRSRLVYATTNYDPLGEMALKGLGRRPDDGQLARIGGSRSDEALDVSDLLDGLPRYTPVLHLHGRVGWYRRENGYIYATDTSKHDSGFGTPIIMLPDPNKVYDGDDVISTLWQTFVTALDRAKRVFVLGHSLNDAALVEALHQHVDPADRIGVALLADELGQFDDSAGQLGEKVKKELPQAGLIPVRFGPEPVVGEQQLGQWLERQ